MNASEIIEIIKVSSPELLGEMPEKKAARFIGVALSHIAKEVAALEEGMVKVQGLGTFRARQVEREKDGQKTMVTKVMFSPVSAAKRSVPA